MTRIGILVPDPSYEEPWDWAFDLEADALRRSGCTVEPIAWTAATGLSSYDLVLPLVAWGYHLRYAEWQALLARAEAEGWRVVNPVPLLRWNSDKQYLIGLQERGVPTVPTITTQACSASDIDAARRRFRADVLVIKPPVSASASGTHRLRPGDELPGDFAGRAMIIQPFIEGISLTGEFSLMLFSGKLSHAVLKRPRSGDFRVQAHLGGATLPAAAPPGAERLAHEALAAAPADAVYARVDMVADDQGTLRIMELELIEPALFLDHAPDGGKAFTDAILNSLQGATA